MGQIDLVEQCIKCCDRVSQEQARPVLLKGLLEMFFNMLDFFDQPIQKSIINILLNVSDRAETEEEFEKNIMPVLPQVCQMLSNKYIDGDRMEKLCKIVSRCAQSFMHF